MRNRIAAVLLLLLVCIPALAQIPVPVREVRYQASDEDFINPERGFMSQLSNPREKLDASVLAGGPGRFRRNTRCRHEGHAPLVLLQQDRG